METQIKDHALEFVDQEQARKLEDTLWWINGRKWIIRNFLRTAGKHLKIKRIMDIGCGSGSSLDVLAEFGAVVGVERSPILAQSARSRNIAEKIEQADIFEMSDLSDFDLFAMFDVLEHIEDDYGVVGRLRKTAGNHLLLISVPACPFLYSEHDRLLHHFRRYSKAALKDVIEQNGYEIIRISHFMFLLFPLALLSRFKGIVMSMFGHRPSKIDVGVVPAWLNRLLFSILKLEAWVSNYISFPIGLWLFVLAKPRKQPSMGTDAGVS